MQSELQTFRQSLSFRWRRVSVLSHPCQPLCTIILV